LESQSLAAVFIRLAWARRVGVVEGSVRLNQVIAPIAKRMCRAEPMKGFIHWLLEVGKADFDELNHRSIFALKSKKA